MLRARKSLYYVLHKFDDAGWSGSFTSGPWKIANGGYDLWFELYYNNEPVGGCVAGDVETLSYGGYDFTTDEKVELMDYIVKTFPHLKKTNFSRVLTASKNQFLSLATEYFKDKTEVSYECVVDKNGNILKIDDTTIEVITPSEDIDKTNYKDKYANPIKISFVTLNGKKINFNEKRSV